MEEKLFLEKFICLAENLSFSLTEEQGKSFYQYMNLLIEWNQKMNLTAIIEPDDVILKHFIDSITINKYIEKEDTDIIDIGTGAGFPGIPIKIIHPEINITLLDSLQKRIIFLEEVICQLQLSQINCIHARAEETSANKQYRESYSIAVSRAVARLNILVEYMLPFVKKGGKCICMKGPNLEELDEAKKAIELLGGEVQQVDKLILPESNIERNIIIIRKIKDTPKKYPRKVGQANKQPIF